MNNHRMTTPLDNEAMSRYFTARAKASPEDQARMERAFDETLASGERLKTCAERALEVLAPKV